MGRRHGSLKWLESVTVLLLSIAWRWQATAISGADRLASDPRRDLSATLSSGTFPSINFQVSQHSNLALGVPALAAKEHCAGVEK